MRHRRFRQESSAALAPARRGRGRLRAAVATVAAAVGACTARHPSPASVAAPRADFLLAAGDSTFWVTSGPSGVHVRGSPLVLARYGGRFYEVYVADEDHSFYDAVFTTQRIYRRDLVTGDSAAVFLDSAVTLAARGYATAHPYERPLTPEEDAADDPSTSVTGEVDIVDVHGPFLSFEYRGSANARGVMQGDDDASPERETLHRGVVDLRVGARANPRTLFGSALGDTAVRRGRRAFATALGSIVAARVSGDRRARLAAAAVGDFVFDPMSFAVTEVDRDPGVQFFAPGRGSRGRGLTLPLSPVAMPEAAGIPWWEAERAALPAGGSDSASDLWSRAGVQVVARYDTAGGPEQGQGVVVLIRQPRSVAIAVRSGPAAARDTVGREWRVGRFPAPTRRLYWLDRPVLDSATRHALLRAFNESALYGDDARSVRRPLMPARRRAARVAFAALAGGRPSGRHPASSAGARRLAHPSH